MREFAPGSSHTATLPIAVAPAGLACEVELWLSPDGETKSASSGLTSFTSTGLQQQLSLAVDMPSEEATYQVLIDIYCEGNLIGAYQALEDVSIVPEIPEIIDPKIGLVGYPGWSAYSIPGDFIAGAELSVSFQAGLIEPNGEHYLYEFCLIKDSEIIPIGSQDSMAKVSTSLSWVPEFIVILPDTAGDYDTMLRIYRDGVLAAQYPYLGTITVLPRGVSNFSYSKPTIRVYWDSSWPAYRVRTSCAITNLGSVYEERKVSLWRLRQSVDSEAGVYYKIDYGWRCLRPRPEGEIILGLNPGQSYNYYYDELVYAGAPEKVCVQLRDEDGNMSAKSDMVTVPG